MRLFRRGTALADPPPVEGVPSTTTTPSPVDPGEDIYGLMAEAYLGGAAVAVFPGGPSRALIAAGDPESNGWFVEPALRGPLAARAASGSLPPPVDEATAQAVGMAFTSSTADGWPEWVTEWPDGLNVAAFRQHVALMLDVFGGTAVGFRDARAARTRAGWSPEVDPLYSLTDWEAGK